MTLKKNSEYLRLILIEHQLLKLYQDISGHVLSRKERQQLTNDEDAFIYGEIEFLAFYTLLQMTKSYPDEIFYDLGSGIGKAAFAAAFYGGFTKIFGIEILPGLHKVAETQLKKASQLMNNDDVKKRLDAIQFINFNFLNYDFSNADVIFINATCFSYWTWHKLLEKFNLLKSGSRIIVTTKKINLDSFKLLTRTFIPINNSRSFVSIYLKIN